MICQNDQVFLCGFRDEWVIAAPAVILIVQLAITDIGNSINCWDRCWLLCGGGGVAVAAEKVVAEAVEVAEA